MTGQQAVRLIDRVRSQAQQHKLNDLQSTIVLATWEGKTYRSIADRLAYDLDYIKQIAARLWKLLSQLLGENICKSNIKSVLERYQASMPIADWCETIELARADRAEVELQATETWVMSDRITTIAFLCSTETTKMSQSFKLDLRQVKGEIESSIWQNSHQPMTPNLLMNEILAALTARNFSKNDLNCLIVNCYYPDAW
jgi:hypothetical protein